MIYSEKIQELKEMAINEIVETHQKLISEYGKPQRHVNKKYPEIITNIYDMPVREFKTIFENFSFKISAIGVFVKDSGEEIMYVRIFTTKTRSYRRIPLDKLDTLMLFDFADHLKSYYSNL